jgi:hypothetical protein
MIFGRIYRSWDERSLQQITPEREQRLLNTWAKLSKFGFLRLYLSFLGALLLFRLICEVLNGRTGMGLGFYLSLASIDLVLGFALSLIVYFGYRMWAVKIGNWRAEGRL